MAQNYKVANLKNSLQIREKSLNFLLLIHKIKTTGQRGQRE